MPRRYKLYFIREIVEEFFIIFHYRNYWGLIELL